VTYRNLPLPTLPAQGGFGTVQWIEPQHFLASRPDSIVLKHPTRTLQVELWEVVAGPPLLHA